MRHYNCERPHQALGMAVPAEQSALAASTHGELIGIDPVPPRASAGSDQPPAMTLSPTEGVRRWVDRKGNVHLAGFRYRVPIVLAGEPVACVVAENLVQIFHRQVLVASHVEHRRPERVRKPGRPPAQSSRRTRQPTVGPVVTMIVDNGGAVSFAGTTHAAGRAWRGKQLQSRSSPARCS